MPNDAKKFQSFQRYSKANKFKLTKAESLFKELLESLEVKFKQQRGFLTGLPTFFMTDFYLPKPYRVVIEVDGGYHFTEEQRVKDLLREEYLLGRRYHIIRFKNEDIEDRIDWVEEKLLEFMDKAEKANKSARLRKERPVYLEVTYGRKVL